MASQGIKALVPIDRPFLDYVMSGLAEAGYRHVCLVIGPEHDVVRDYYGSIERKRIEIHFAVQELPRGTADAVAAAEQFAAADPFLVINSDNYYPQEALRDLRSLTTPGWPCSIVTACWHPGTSIRSASPGSPSAPPTRAGGCCGYSRSQLPKSSTPCRRQSASA